MEINHHVLQALKARNMMKRDVDYIVRDGEVIIIDEFTGRMMFGRRYSDGLHQAIEAKEHVLVRSESKTLATITLQNYFRMYQKLSGMTGTAKTEEGEFRDIYNMDVVVIPTNKPIARNDLKDAVYATEHGKYKSIVDAVESAHKKGQPVLVGTISIEKSELIATMLRKRGIKDFNILNAKHHEKEAQIIAQAGRLGAITIATNPWQEEVPTSFWAATRNLKPKKLWSRKAMMRMLSLLQPASYRAKTKSFCRHVNGLMSFTSSSRKNAGKSRRRCGSLADCLSSVQNVMNQDVSTTS